MEWLCKCEKPVTTAGVQWVWGDAAVIGQREGGYVSCGLQIGCGDCVNHKANNNYQHFQIRLSAQTKAALVDQFLAEVLKQAPRSYLPKIAVKRALREIHKADSVT
jgi:hypothetical protein